MPKRGPPKSYTESVENRLQRVEKALKSIATPVVNRVFDDSLKSKDFCNQIASTEGNTPSKLIFLVHMYNFNSLYSFYISTLYHGSLGFSDR